VENAVSGKAFFLDLSLLSCNGSIAVQGQRAAFLDEHPFSCKDAKKE
jgi:hypothetical protein